MAEQTHGGRGGEGSLLRGVILITVTGVLLGLAYNYMGLRNQTWGLSWIAEDRAADLPTLELGEGTEPAASGGETGGLDTATDDPMAVVSDDPMAIPASPAVDGLPPIPDLGRPIQMQLTAVKRFFDADGALIIDAREAEEFHAGHIAGAINLPYDEVITDPARLESIDTGGRPSIIYCGGGTCEVSLNLAYEMVRLGHSKVLVFMGGYPEWEAAGYPIGTGEGEVH